jgi:tetratricopeptide (TPR) repeat protein/tRNA A-37 threonylcarbamoyl transferase component Bud32
LPAADAGTEVALAAFAATTGGGASAAGLGSSAARAVSGPFAVGQSFGPRYHIIRLLGAGGMGAVYQAWDDQLGISVAIKVIRPEVTADPEVAEQMERRFKRELLLARQVTHKNVVRIHDLGELEGIRYLTMEYIQGASLATILKREGRLAVPRALKIAKQLVAGLAAAHEVGVIHRDLKPANVMIDADGNALITDFGIARSLSPSTAMTGAAEAVGTLEFMAPEQARAEAVDQRADIYAFGLMFRDMLAGPRQVTGESMVAELMARMQRSLASVRELVPNLPEETAAIVDQCVQPNPADRFQMTAELAHALEALDDEGRLRPGFGIRQRPRVARSQRGLAWAAVAALVVLLAGVVTLRDRLPWTGRRSSAAIPAQPVTLAIVPFRNASGDRTLDWLGPSLAEMLRSDIGQSPHLRSTSPDRLNQILRDLRIPPDANFDPVTLRKLADLSNAQTVLWGQYLKFGNEIRLDATLQDLRRDRSVPLKAEASTEKSVLGAVAELAESVRSNLALAPDIIKELKANSFKPSSQSVQALRYYNEGLQLSRQGKQADALKSFEASVREDPEFALAYSKLGQTYANLGYDSEAQRFSRQAVELSASGRGPERYLIIANHARVVHDANKAIEAYQNLMRVSAGDPEIRLELAKLYEDTNQLDKSREQYANILVGDPKYLDALVAMGRVEMKSADPQAALQHLTQALALTAELDADEAKGDVLQTIGIAYKTLNKPDDALRNYQQALEIRRRLGQKRGVANTLSEIAQIQQKMGKPEDALKSYQEALQLRREIGDKRGIGSSFLDLGLFYAGRSQYEEALRFYKDSLQIQRDVGNETYEAACLSNIGNVYLAKGEYEDAITYYDRALRLREQRNVPTEIALLRHNLAEASFRLGQYDQSLGHYLTALDLRRKADDKRGAALESHGIGTLAAFQGRYGAALNATEEALKTFRALQDRSFWFATMLKGYGDALGQIGRPAEAQASFDEAMTVAKQLQNQSLIAEILASEGDTAFYRGDLQAARTLSEQALQAASRTKDDNLMLRSKINLSKVAVKEGRPQAAIKALPASSQQADARGLKYLATESSIWLADALLDAKDYARARHEAERALDSSERSGFRALLAESHYLVATALRLTGNESEARRHYTDSVRLLDEIRKEAGKDDVLKRADLAPIYADASRWSQVH